MVWVMLAEREEMLTTAPLPTVSTIWRAASLVSVSGAVTLKAKVRAMNPSLVSRAARGMAPPALLTRMSSRPNSWTARATSASQAAASVTSVGTTSARRPTAATAAATSRRSDSVRAASTTSAPASARPTAIPRPMPSPAPVTMATFPVTVKRSRITPGATLSARCAARREQRGRPPRASRGR